MEVGLEIERYRWKIWSASVGCISGVYRLWCGGGGERERGKVVVVARLLRDCDLGVSKGCHTFMRERHKLTSSYLEERHNQASGK